LMSFWQRKHRLFLALIGERRVHPLHPLKQRQGRTELQEEVSEDMGPSIENPTWKTLCRTGGIAALLAAILFRRNIGAEVSLFTGVAAIPHSAADWYALLQSNPFVGLSFLAVFDLADYALVGLIFLALAAAFWPAHKSAAAIALASGMVGVAVSLSSNISLTMLTLSHQYAAATSAAQQAALLAAGQAILATSDPLAVYPTAGAYSSLLLIAVAGLLFSIILLRYHRAAGIVGLLAAGCDLVYCLTIFFAPSLRALLLAAGGLFWMVWHLLVGLMLLQLSKK
jgi:hypothetical protein